MAWVLGPNSVYPPPPRPPCGFLPVRILPFLGEHALREIFQKYDCFQNPSVGPGLGLGDLLVTTRAIGKSQILKHFQVPLNNSLNNGNFGAFGEARSLAVTTWYEVPEWVLDYLCCHQRITQTHPGATEWFCHFETFLDAFKQHEQRQLNPHSPKALQPENTS